MIRHLRSVGFAEACSYIALVGVAMPLKYLADMPLAVTIVGSLHGALWMWYLVAVFLPWWRSRFGTGFAIVLVALSLVPLGPFLIDGRLKRLETETV